MRAFYALRGSSRRRIACLIACAWVGLCLVPNLAGHTISAFPFESPPTSFYAHSALKVGPDGGIWFVLGEPLRLMRIHEGQLNCVYQTDIYEPSRVDLVVAPDGTLYLDNFG